MQETGGWCQPGIPEKFLPDLPVIRAFRREKKEEERFDGANRELTKTMLFTNRVMTFMMPGMMLIMNVLTVGIVWVGSYTKLIME